MELPSVGTGIASLPQDFRDFMEFSAPEGGREQWLVVYTAYPALIIYGLGLMINSGQGIIHQELITDYERPVSGTRITWH